MMPSPLPGMNPYLESSTFWSAFHSRLIVAIADAIAPTLRPLYYVEIETRKPQRVLLPVPEEIKERYLEIREVATGAVITVIEILSPKNKTLGIGRTTYQQKRQAILGSLTHLIEIDLLRAGKPMEVSGEATDADYRILVSRSWQRPFADLYGFSLRERISNFPLPLQSGELEPIVELQMIVQGIYERGGYDLRIDYQQPPLPPTLSSTDSTWLKNCLNG